MKGEFHFTSNVVRYFTISTRELFHIRRKPNISLLVAVLFIFCHFYGIIQLIDKLEFIGGDKYGQCYISLRFEWSRKKHTRKSSCRKLNIQFIDIEDIYFSKLDNPNYPYENPRPYGEVVSLLTNIVNSEGDFVLASVAGSFGDEFISHLKCVISIEVPREIRLKRVYDRSYMLFGEKSCKGGEFFEQIMSFHNFCASRDENLVNDWLSTICCPIIRVDGTLPICDNVNLIAEEL